MINLNRKATFILLTLIFLLLAGGILAYFKYSQKIYNLAKDNIGKNINIENSNGISKNKTEEELILEDKKINEEPIIPEKKYVYKNNGRSYYEQLKGKILIEVDKNGAGWYVNPNQDSQHKLIYLGNPERAIDVFNGIGNNGSITSEEIYNFQIADFNLNTWLDNDHDDLSDLVEKNLKTDLNKADTDGDGFNDKEEILAGYNPLGDGNINYKKEFTEKYRDLIISVNGAPGLWYISSDDLKAYYIGERSRDAFNLMKKFGLGISEDDIEKFKIETQFSDIDSAEIILKVKNENSENKKTDITKIKSFGNNFAWTENEWTPAEGINYYALNELETENYNFFRPKGKLILMKKDYKINLKNLQSEIITEIKKTENEIKNLGVSNKYTIWEEFENFYECWEYDSNKNIVWKPCDGSSGRKKVSKRSLGIFYYNIENKQINKILSNSDKAFSDPVIYGNKVVYWDKRSWAYIHGNKMAGRNVGDVYLYNLDTKEEEKLTSNANNYEPKIFNNIVAWFSDENVYYKNISNAEIKQLTDDNKFRGELNISEKYIAWDNYGDNWEKTYEYGANRGIEYYDINEQTIKKIKLIEKNENGLQRLPIIDGNYIIYEAKGGESPNYSLYLLNLSNDYTKKIYQKSYDNFTVSAGSIYWVEDTEDNEAIVYGYDFTK